MERKLLITGFDPFGGADVNPSWEAVKLLPEQLAGFRVVKLRVPTVFSEAPSVVMGMAGEISPAAIISVGQAGGRKAITPERIGINLMDARIPDNSGASPKGLPILPGGPDGLFSTLPVEAMAAAVRGQGLPGEVSNTAGTFVCNCLLYSLLYRTAGTGIRAGFIHIPLLPQQGEPSLPLGAMARGLAAAIEAAAASL